MERCRSCRLWCFLDVRVEGGVGEYGDLCGRGIGGLIERGEGWKGDSFC